MQGLKQMAKSEFERSPVPLLPYLYCTDVPPYASLSSPGHSVVVRSGTFSHSPTAFLSDARVIAEPAYFLLAATVVSAAHERGTGSSSNSNVFFVGLLPAPR